MALPKDTRLAIVNHMSKKILIISCAAGTGHIRAAQALNQTIRADFPDLTVEQIDLLDYSDWLVKKTVGSGYHFIARRLPKIYGLLYRTLDWSDHSAEMFDIFLDLFKINLRRFNRFVRGFRPDHIVATHFLVPPLLEKKIKNSTIDYIMTDYDINNVCLSPVIRYYFTPDAEFRDRLNAAGKKAFAYGLPLDQNFFIPKNAAELKKNYPLNPDWPVILVASGGLGLADPTPIVKNILENFSRINLLVVTGRGNKKQKNKILELTRPKNINFQIIEYTDKFDELLRISDLVITKPGGLTVTEAIFLKKPMLLYSPIPGQEEANAKFLEKNNLAVLIPRPENAAELARQILSREKIMATRELSPEVNKKIIAEVIK